MRVAILTAVAAALALAAWQWLAAADRAERPNSAPTAAPFVLIDVGHHNFGMHADLAPLSQWLAESGFQVRAQRGAFTAAALEAAEIVVIKNALAARNAVSPHPSEAELERAWSLPTPSAFTADEIEALHAWVRDGGGLLLVFDHMPMPGAVRELAAAFGVEVSNGNAVDLRALEPFDPRNVERAGRVLFSRGEGTLADDPLTNGESLAERVDSIASDGGSAFRLPAQARSLLVFGPSFVSLTPEVAWRFSPATPRTPVAGWSQGGVLELGPGRLAVFGDGSILLSPAMVQAADFAQSPRLLLNVLRWLRGGAGAR